MSQLFFDSSQWEWQFIFVNSNDYCPNEDLIVLIWLLFEWMKKNFVVNIRFEHLFIREINIDIEEILIDSWEDSFEKRKLWQKIVFTDLLRREYLSFSSLRISTSVQHIEQIFSFLSNLSLEQEFHRWLINSIEILINSFLNSDVFTFTFININVNGYSSHLFPSHFIPSTSTFEQLFLEDKSHQRMTKVLNNNRSSKMKRKSSGKNSMIIISINFNVKQQQYPLHPQWFVFEWDENEMMMRMMFSLDK